MTIWIVAILLLAILGVLGFWQGAVRALITLIGLVLGIVLAGPLGGLLQPLFPMVGVENVVWSRMTAMLTGFLLVVIVAAALAHMLHRKVDWYYKYRTEDYQHIVWERMNKRLGACLGLCNGGILFIAIGVIVYVLGYLTTQASSATASAPVNFVNSARQDLRQTGLDKLMVKFDPAPPEYYKLADLFGLLYHNSLLYGRLANYPDLIAVAESQEFAGLATDAGYLGMLQGQPDPIEVLNHPQTQTLLKNDKLYQLIDQLDLDDLETYLKTGQSPKYADLRLLGRWEMNIHAMMLNMMQKNPDISSSEMSRFRETMGPVLEGYQFAATPDNQVFLEFTVSENLKKLQQKQQEEQEQEQEQSEAGSSPSAAQSSGGVGVAESYGISDPYTPFESQSNQGSSGGQGQAGGQGESESAVSQIETWQNQGTWKQLIGDRYEITVAWEKGPKETFNAQVKEYNLVITTKQGEIRGVFERVY
jgi:hypothetical protein